MLLLGITKNVVHKKNRSNFLDGNTYTSILIHQLLNFLLYARGLFRGVAPMKKNPEDIQM